MAHLNKDSDAQRNIKAIADNFLQNELIKEKVQKLLEQFKFNSFSDALNITTQVFSEHRHNGRPVRSVPKRRRQKRMQTVRDTIQSIFEIEQPSSTATFPLKKCLFYALSILISFIVVVGSGIEKQFIFGLPPGMLV
uniref:Transposase n=1 Tax=Globodera pallida TaxID=36090 RepID=A0A183C8X0_GLOPA